MQLLTHLLAISFVHAVQESYCTMHDYCHSPTLRKETYPAIKDPELRLVQVLVIARHGDRTPVSKLLNDHVDWDQFVDFEGLDALPESVAHDINDGLLTVEGRHQAMIIGKSLSDIYSDRMNSTDILVRSTAYSRSYLTAVYIARMLSKNTTIPFEIRPSDKDSLLMNERACPKLKQLVQSTLQGKRFEEISEEMILLETVAKEHHGLVLQRSPMHMTKDILKGHFTPQGSKFFELADQFFVRACRKDTLISSLQLSEDFCRVSRKAWEITREALATNPQHSRLRVGKLVQELYAAQLKIRSLAGQTRMIIMGAHDTTLAHLNTALQTGETEWPGYASNFVLESYIKGSKSFLRAFYNGRPISFPWAGNLHLIPLEMFYAYIHHLIPTPGECHSFCKFDEILSLERTTVKRDGLDKSEEDALSMCDLTKSGLNGLLESSRSDNLSHSFFCWANFIGIEMHLGVNIVDLTTERINLERNSDGIINSLSKISSAPSRTCSMLLAAVNTR